MITTESAAPARTERRAWHHARMRQTSSWVADRFGARLTGDAALTDLVRLALRRNPRRAHLLVSTVLGKHLPADPRTVHDTGLELGRRVGELLENSSALVLGFAETATGLGHAVAEALGAGYLHSTRREVAGAGEAAAFAEEHSHATAHRLLPSDPALLEHGEVLVLVDDELSTGRTARNTIAALHDRAPRRRYVIAALVDARSDDDRAALATFTAEHGIDVQVIALATGAVDRPDGFAAKVTAEVTAATQEPRVPRATVLRRERVWPAHVRESGRHGFGPADVLAAHAAADTVADELAPDLGADVLVLGTEELMYAPTLIARALAARGTRVQVSASTRSPVLALDEPGYPIRTSIAFPCHDSARDGPGPRFAYNVGTARTDVVLVVDDDADTAELAGLVEQLRGRADRVHVVVLPTVPPLPAPLTGPAFGSYRADEIGWLLTDLSGVALEAPIEEREEAIQSGSAHYAESLPVEYQPDTEYRELFDRALDESAARVACAVGVVTELLLAERGPAPVLASLARAGAPAGVLIRRWARFAHGLELPHYALSIVRGRGIDTAALRYLATHHDPRDVVFVDGWTGKGAIVRELAAALDDANARLGTAFRPDLAVLADPGSCVTTWGTREDFLVPSACLNSTVSGLVSRTVLNPALLVPGQYHGAKYYRELAADDVSHCFLDAVSDRFAEVSDAVKAEVASRTVAERAPTWSGWAEVAGIAARYGIDDLTLVKPGVGETTRVLLRRVPWAVLARPDAGPELDHVRLLAERRGVPIRTEPGLGYRCVGLIRPRS